MHTQDFLEPDRHGQFEQAVTEGDAYRSFAQAVRPRSFYERNRLLYNLTRLVVMIFPFISGGTLFALALLINLDIKRVMVEGLQLDEWVIFALSFIGFTVAISLNETIKTRSLSELFKANARQDTIRRGLFAGAILTCIVSIVGSAWGIYLTNYTIKDDSLKIQQKGQNQRFDARSSWQADSVRIMQDYSGQIAAKDNTIRRYDPNRYRTLISKLQNEKTQLINDREQKLSHAKARYEGQLGTIGETIQGQLTTNKNEATNYALIGLFVLVVLELANIVCHRFNWIFRVRCTLEARRSQRVGQGMTPHQTEALSPNPAGTPDTLFQANGHPSAATPGSGNDISPRIAPIGYETQAMRQGRGEASDDMSSKQEGELITDHIYRLRQTPIGTEITCALPGCFNRFQRKNYKHVYCCKQHRQKAHSLMRTTAAV